MEDERYEWEGEEVSFDEYMERWNAAIEADLREDEERYERERETPEPPPESVYATSHAARVKPAPTAAFWNDGRLRW